MTTISEKLKSLVEGLEAQCDEMRANLALSNPEGVKLWKTMDGKWEEIQAKYQRSFHSVGKALLHLEKDIEQEAGELSEIISQFNETQQQQAA